MLLGLTILLVLLAWTLGNTISRSTNRSTLDAPTGRLLHRIPVSRAVWYVRSSLPTLLSFAIELLRRIELQTVLASPSPLRDVVVGSVAKTGHLPDCCALLIGRNSVGLTRHPSLTAGDSSNSNRRSLLRPRCDVG